ncbi:MAG TPA: FHA domain-containing serine/threonine-protein kinase [Pyrinomonadaceae bacterium]|nr:FHA domain-containing serine/threonine-protein kinase [Pyrinomonadaceae bacterium]
MQVNLKVLAGPYRDRVFCFTQTDTFLIGRSNDAHLCLTDDRFFSRHHCLLEINPPHCFLRDLGSTNGTFVNGEKVTEAYLKSGAQIQGGETVLLVEVDIGGGETSKTTSPGPARPTIVTVACLNCGRREEAQASFADEQMTFLCEDCRAELKESPQPIPGYDTVKLLGRGGMGTVMLGRSQATGAAVAIKTLLPEFAVSEKHMRRFMREIDVAASLKHPSIVQFIERGLHNGVVYLVTEYIDGADAARRADSRGGRLPEKETLEIILQTLDGLAYAHAQGYIHRDIKDQNILVRGELPNLSAKLTDFGLAKSFAQSGMSGVTMAGEMAGTLAYMSPEQLKNFRDVKPQSDIYALGMTAYSLLSGQLALDISRSHNMAQTIKAIFECPPIPLQQRAPHVPAAVCEVIDRALVKDPTQRWKSAQAMRTALTHASKA